LAETSACGYDGIAGREVNVMRKMIAVGLLAALFAGAAAAQEKKEIKLDVVKYDVLRDAVAKERGKVVLVDFWGEF
jgi:hypothetical protein